MLRQEQAMTMYGRMGIYTVEGGGELELFKFPLKLKCQDYLVKRRER